MFDPFELIFVQRGVLEIAALSIAAGLIGTWIVLRGIAFYAHAVGTASFPGPRARRGAGLLGAPRGRRDRARRRRIGRLAGATRPQPLRQRHGARARRRAGARRDPRQRRLSLRRQRRDAAVRQRARDQRRRTSGSRRRSARSCSSPRSCSSSAGWRRDSILMPRARSARARRSRICVLLGLVALVAIAALSAVGALLATALLVVPAATTRLLCSRLRTWQLATIGLVLLEGVAGPVARRAAQRAPGRDDRRARRGRVRARRGRPPRRSQGPRGSRRRGGAAARAGGRRLRIVGPVRGGDGGGASNAISVVATTTQLGDIVRNVGGDGVDVTQILKPNSDPHDVRAAPARRAARRPARSSCSPAATASTSWIGEVVSQSGGDPTVVDLGDAVGAKLAGESSGPEASRFDPHWWHDPRNVERAIAVIRDALVRANPSARATLRARRRPLPASRAQARRRACARASPACRAAQRKLVTDHDAFSYFANRYGIDVIGAVIPSQTTAGAGRRRATSRSSAR